jgi:glycine betaine/proline transport system ATP-binding protein
MAEIALRHVTKIFGPAAPAALALARQGVGKAEILAHTGCSLSLHDINLDIAAGQIFALMGQSGSGKSTLVRHLNRLIEPSEGAILFNGADITRLPPAGLRAFRRQTVSMVFQGFALLPHRTVLQNVGFGLRLRGTPPQQANAISAKWIEKVGLAGYADAYPHSLSGGMRQRVGLARALAVDTDVILMDEPFSALDPLIRLDMQDVLLGLQRHLHKTIIFVTHDMTEAQRLASTIAILHEGTLLQVAPPAELIAHPANDYVARFIKT